MDTYGYQPSDDGNLDKSNPPLQCFGVPKITYTGQVQRCPVCRGCGQVDSGFYTQTSGDWSSIGGMEQCRSCDGKGYVVI